MNTETVSTGLVRNTKTETSRSCILGSLACSLGFVLGLSGLVLMALSLFDAAMPRFVIPALFISSLLLLTFSCHTLDCRDRERERRFNGSL